MRNWKLDARILFLVLVLGGIALLVPVPGSADPNSLSYFEWVVTPAAAVGTAAGRCPDGQICKELCELSESGATPLGTFNCFPE